MKMQRQGADAGLERRPQRCPSLWRKQAAWVLDVDGVHAERDKLARLARIVIVGMNGAHGVDDAAGGIEPDLLGSAYRHFHIAHVVQRVIGRVIADAVGEYPLGRELDDVVGEELE